MPTVPYVELSTVDVRARLKETYGKWFLCNVADPASEVRRVVVRRSFLTLEIMLAACSGPVKIAINGREVLPSGYGTVNVASVTLENDIDYYRIDVFSFPNQYLALEVFIQHHFEIGGAELGGKFCSYKWTFENYLSELERWRPLFGGVQRAVVPNLLGNWANSLPAYEPEWHRSAMHCILEVTKILTLVPPRDYWEDFALFEEGDADLERLLEFVQEDGRLLSRSQNGPIRYKGQRYSPAILPFANDIATGLDFSPIASIVLAVRQQLRLRAGTSGAIILAMDNLMSAAESLPSRRNDEFSEAAAFLTARMKGAAGERLQTALRRLVHIVCLNGSRDSLSKVADGLMQGIRDFDVFETSVFAACGLALGFSEADVISARGLLKSQKHILANLNKAQGQEYFAHQMRGWRGRSAQPSDYAPDLFILYETRVPIFVDAKFRLGHSTELIANASGLKEFQAYMDEFGLDYGLVIVPKSLHKSVLSQIGPQTQYISGTGRKGMYKKIVVAELPDSSNPASIANVRDAIAELGHFGN